MIYNIAFWNGSMEYGLQYCHIAIWNGSMEYGLKYCLLERLHGV